MTTAIQDIPYKIPKSWDAAWFARFIRDVLANADVRNAIEGSGITITGASGEPATISASDDLQQLLVQPFVLTAPSGFLTQERTLAGESGVITITDGGANGNATVGIQNGGVALQKLQDVAGLSVIANPYNATGQLGPLLGTAQYDVLHVGSGPVLEFSAIDHNYISDFNEAAQDAVGTILVDSTTIDFTYSDATPSITAIVIDDSITNAKLRNSVGVSVIGRAANSTGDPADIAAASDDTLLRRTSSTVNFGQLTVGMFPDDVVTYAKIQNVSATSRVLGRITLGAGDIEELTGANLATIIGTALGANPSASVGLAAVNGTAGTYMRSDAAPALSQSISPTWSGTHTFSNQVLFADGSVGTPIVSFGSDTNTGIYHRASADNFAFAAGGTRVLDFIFFGAGNARVAFFTGDQTNSTSSLVINDTTNSINVIDIRGDGQVRTTDGSAATPSQSYLNDTDTGRYRIGANNMGDSVAGSLLVDYSANRVAYSAPVRLPNSTVAGLVAAATAGAGALAFVTDATLTAITGLGLAVTGGGANKVPVYSDGTNWIII